MRRRRGRSTPLNLFSFQDIVASLIGMIFLIVLIMSLSIVQESAVYAVDKQASDDKHLMAAMRAEIPALRDQIAKLEHTLLGSYENLDLLPLTPDEAAQENRNAARTVEALYGEIKTSSEAARKAAEQNTDLFAHLENREKEIQKIEGETRSLRAKIKDAVSSARVTYIIDGLHAGVKPWLVEVSGSAIRVGAQDGVTAVLEFKGDTAEARRQGFLSWTKSQDSRTHYFVVIMKPSGWKEAEKLLQELEHQGFKQGLDLLPEEEKPF